MQLPIELVIPSGGSRREICRFEDITKQVYANSTQTNRLQHRHEGDILVIHKKYGWNIYNNFIDLSLHPKKLEDLQNYEDWNLRASYISEEISELKKTNDYLIETLKHLQEENAKLWSHISKK